ncbi:MAG TPA: hypothetical protein VLN42_12490, partial [Casimicrobiaceae bacterium]|nr:hypothetical protein [Casimicrobiaceae bacterium]
MSKTISFLVGLVLAMAGSSVLAQPADSADQAARKLNPYVYMRNAAGDKVFLETQIWRNDPNYDARALRRISDVMAGLEKLGFKGSLDAANGWDKPEKVVRCRINMEVINKRWRGKTGAIVACENTGISDAEVVPSEDPKHVSL